MAIKIDDVMQVIIHAVIEATKAAVYATILERGDETIRHRSEEAGMRPKLYEASFHKRGKEHMQNL